MVLQQNDRFSAIEEKYKSLQGKTSSLFDMEEEVLKVSEKLTTSEDDLQEALSTVSLATRLQQDISTLHAAVTVMQNDENSASRDLQTVSGHFLNVTETWQVRLATIASDLTALKSESREAHAGATERVNEAERQARSLAEKLEELEDSTKRNARAMERTEGDDTKRSQEHLDWNTKQIHHLEEKISSLTKREAELDTQLQEHIPRAKECEQHLPQVEDAVRSILRLAGDLSGAEKRLEEVTLQVFGTEDSMLKALGEILEIRQELDTLQAQNSILKMKNELSVVKEAVHELTMVLRGTTVDTLKEEDTLDEEGWREEEEEDVQLMLQGLEGQRGALGPQLEGLQQDVSRLQEWSSGLNEKRAQLQGSLSSLRDAVGQIEERTSAIAKDFVASVRTDVRRMEGLRSELESLLTQVTELEDKTSQVEHSMVKRIGDVLANSIDRVQNLRDASERNTKAIEQLRKRVPELTAADTRISERLRELESGRARLIRTVTFANDLKPKVASIKRDLGAFEPQLSDLTLRIGRLAEDLMKREQEVAELRQTLANLTAVEGDLSVTAKQVSEIADISDIGAMHRPT
ncbi:hypothetical protein F7725_021657 [Dissostichus mawsoni]|uniref:IKBKB interacting protein n=1 Tax=Dissostichus mawsoni TaxID=36200 RepID=A0A7J5ZFX8_DISMA|nr:hypothetical protein F7725_021657 [Dissostichus mawsoni]